MTADSLRRVIIERAEVSSPESRALMEELWAEVDQLYGNEAPSRPALTGMDSSRAGFIVAREGMRAVGCVALRPLKDDIAEVKRMYVQPIARRRGIAGEMMRALEQIARDSGFNEIWLETGFRQPAAIQLYESLGYTPIAGFGDYKDDPLSVCYGKRLNSPRQQSG